MKCPNCETDSISWHANFFASLASPAYCSECNNSFHREQRLTGWFGSIVGSGFMVIAFLLLITWGAWGLIIFVPIACVIGGVAMYLDSKKEPLKVLTNQDIKSNNRSRIFFWLFFALLLIIVIAPIFVNPYEW